MINPEKEKILYAARGKFISEGFYKTPMDELAHELGVSKKTIYKYFPSKERLVEEVAGLQIREVTHELLEVINGKVNVVAKFANIFDVYSGRIMNCSEKWYKDLQVHAPHVWKKIDKVRSERINESLGKLIRNRYLMGRMGRRSWKGRRYG